MPTDVDLASLIPGYLPVDWIPFVIVPVKVNSSITYAKTTLYYSAATLDKTNRGIGLSEKGDFA
jgi:hypothetical protein